MIKKITKAKAYPAVFMVLSVIAAILFRSCRQNMIFVTTTVGFNLPSVLLALMIVCSVLFTVLFRLRLDGNEFCGKKAYRLICGAFGFLSVFLFIFSLCYIAGCATEEAREVVFLYFRKSVSECAFLLIIPFFTLFYPKLSGKMKKAVAAVSLSAVALCTVNAYYPLTPFEITGDPVVIDNGSGYSIVFATNDEGSAYAEYTYDGKDYKIFDNEGGRLNADSLIHSISVPYEHLRNNTYKVGSTRVIEEYGYGSRLGAETVSKDYKFIVNENENQTWLVVSDWHSMLSKAYSAIGHLQADYDGVILLGDSAPSMDFEQQAVTTIVEFGGQVSGGTKPVLYVRGNHETRGDYANELPDALGLEKLYYTADFGDYSFVVLDSGEDKEDSHIEYGGMNDYNTYRADMIEWLKGVEVKNEKVIAISHAWQITSVEPELSAEGWAQLDRLGARLMLSGHEHRCGLVENEQTENYPRITAYIDGGNMKGGYVASLLTVTEEGFELKAVDNLGNEVFGEQFTW